MGQASHVMTDDPNQPFTVDERTQASNPGQLRINYLYWLRSFPQKPARLILPLIFLAGIAFFLNHAFAVAVLEKLRTGQSIQNLPFVLLSPIIFNVLFWFGISQQLNQLIWLFTHVREHFIYGCTTPGIVVSAKPALVAVITDLRTRETEYPVIKVLPQPLHWMKHGVPPIGTKLATVALYSGSLHNDHWDDFHPIVINCVTGNQADINRVFRSIPQQDWLELEVGLEQVPKKPGLYPICL
jgi:hypothetical protein